MEKKEDAADMVSNAFFKALQNAKNFEARNPNAIKSWIYRIASNEVLLHYRRKKVEQKFYIEKKFLQSISEELKDKNQNIDLLIMGLENLNQDEYELVQMKYFDSLPFKEIALILGKTEESLRISLFRIRKKLATELTKLSHSKGIEIILTIAVLILAL